MILSGQRVVYCETQMLLVEGEELKAWFIQTADGVIHAFYVSDEADIDQWGTPQ